MTRPEEIPQDVWDAAKQALQATDEAEQSYMITPITSVARAILAEREAQREGDAKIAESFVGQTDFDLEPEAAVAENVTARAIAAAIRGTP
jgi:hypothetical protein